MSEIKNNSDNEELITTEIKHDKNKLIDTCINRFEIEKKSIKEEFIFISPYMFLFIILFHSGFFPIAQKNPSLWIWLCISIIAIMLVYLTGAIYVYKIKIKEINKIIAILNQSRNPIEIL